ncbi:hypothetical protein NFI96_021255, partial [Prochilodus magdalenae]
IYQHENLTVSFSGENVALGGAATQSSLYSSAFASAAIDGNRDGVFSHGSCTHTSNDHSPWWRLDLLKQHKVFSIVIVNRQDGVPERLNGAEIRIGDSLNNNGNNNPRCGVISTASGDPTFTVDCKGMEGRYINIVIPGRSEYLTLCEVEVADPSEHRAHLSTLAQTCLETSDLSEYQSAIWTGVSYGQILGTCSSREKSPECVSIMDCWISSRQNFGPTELRRLKRGGGSTGRNMERHVFYLLAVLTAAASTDASPMRSTHTPSPLNRTTFKTVVPGIAEQSHMASSIPAKNLALYGKATQSSLVSNPYAPYGHAYNAIDGNTDPDFFHASCTHTDLQQNPWWRVDLLDEYTVTSITITNRADCCPERINGAEIHIGNSLLDDGNSNPRAGVISSIPDGNSVTLNFEEGFSGRYVNVLLPVDSGVVTLCEVEVYGYPTPHGENVALGGRAAQSSLYDRGFPANAIDGNRDAAYVHGSCTRTVKELSPWWRLDLLNRHKVFNITVTPSLGAHSVQPKGAEIRIGDSLENHGNRNPREGARRCGVIGTARRDPTFTFNCKGMEGRYINIVIPGRSESLLLCEVEVYGAPLD